MKMNRRELGKGFGAAAAAGLFAKPAAAAGATDLSFPSDFRWGCATAAYQIEGDVTDDGRAPTD